MPVSDFFNSAEALRLGFWLGKHVPRRAGFALADLATSLIARQRDSVLVRTVHSNLRRVLGPEATEDQVRAMASAVFRHAGRAYFDFYRTLGHGMDSVVEAVELSPWIQYYLDDLRAEGRGAVVVGAHMSNFDMGSLAIGRLGLPITVLGWASPTSGYDIQNEIRREAGLDWIPMDVRTLRRALRALREGRILVTGVDRPDPFGAGEMLPFFGEPARMPVGHVRLALQAQVPILVVVPEYRGRDRPYVMHLGPRIELEHVGTRQEDVLHNARRVLGVLERIIRAHPEQWLMFYPVWEEHLVGGPPRLAEAIRPN